MNLAGMHRQATCICMEMHAVSDMVMGVLASFRHQHHQQQHDARGNVALHAVLQLENQSSYYMFEQHGCDITGCKLWQDGSHSAARTA